jgi:mannose/cellobiose epimerase-like protein (N-acyl-D-glucosamine 2-epimerase family)
LDRQQKRHLWIQTSEPGAFRNSQTHHFKLFFDDQWRSLSDHVSYGHDIEGSWLLAEAAQVQGDTELLEQVRKSAVKMVDRIHGDWYKLLHRDGTPDRTSYKAGPWECPYHHSRACLEMLARLDDSTDNE